jgi:hypothetical protein
MNNIVVNDQIVQINKEDYKKVCDRLNRRIKRILYLRDDLLDNVIDEYDAKSYINALIWDLYGNYVTYKEYRFLNCISELEGVKANIYDSFARKKILDVASFVLLICE